MDIRGREKERKNICFSHDVKDFAVSGPKLARCLLIIDGKGWSERKTGAGPAVPGGIGPLCRDLT